MRLLSWHKPYKEASFLNLAKLSYSFLSLYQFPNMLPFAFPMSWNISERSFNAKFFASITFSGINSPFFHNLYLIYVESSPSLISCGCITSLSKGGSGSVNIPPVSSFLYNSTILVKCCYQHYHFLFLCHTFIFLGQLPLSIMQFYKMLYGLIWRQGGNPTTCFAVCG